MAHQKWCVSIFFAIIEINQRRALMIGENIKTLRKTHDLTQPEFAKIIGISRNSLSRYENGTSSVSTELVDRICKKSVNIKNRIDKGTRSEYLSATLSFSR